MANSNDIKHDLDILFDSWEKKDTVKTTYTEKGKIKEVTIDHSDKFIRDGVVNINTWNDTEHKKILYVLKETPTENKKVYSLADDWLANYPEETIKKAIWKRIARWTYGIQKTDLNGVPKYFEEIPMDIYKECIDQIAVLNLKKSSGKSTSINEEIEAYAKVDKYEIQKEIEIIDPEIIICGYTYSALIDKVFDLPVQKDPDNYAYHYELCNKKRLVIDYYHPSNQYPDIANYYAVTNIYLQALKR